MPERWHNLSENKHNCSGRCVMLPYYINKLRTLSKMHLGSTEEEKNWSLNSTCTVVLYITGDKFQVEGTY